MPLPHSRTARTRTAAGLVGVGLAVLLGVGTVPTAGADDLTDRRDRIRDELAASTQDIDEFSAELNRAADALQHARSQLDAARQRQATATRERDRAQARDRAAARSLATAQQQLARARAAVTSNEAALRRETRVVGAAVRETHQQSGDLVGIAAVVNDANVGDVNQALQWSTTIFNATGAQMARLEAAQVRLEAARERQVRAERRVQAQRDRAARALATSRGAEQRAVEATAAVRALVASHQRAQQVVASRLRAEQARQSRLVGEQAAVGRRIHARIAAQRAAAARASARARAASAAASAARASGNSWFVAPVDGPITSLYGRRFHPVLHVWKLHDGTDYGAGCGAPIRAPRAGVVSERYFNEGYGERLMIDHGQVGGRWVTTGYNHATHYTVGVGQRVRAGQLIGYVGNTGYSTGCHLHLMVWQDGAIVNPTDTWF